MQVTRVFEETAKAYLQGFRTIGNKGGTRSSKTFSELQLFYNIMAMSKKPRVISVVSHSFPHLEGGAIRDFENILNTENVNIEKVRTKKPHIYRINKSICEFIGFDKPGKALGAARDILLINEGNKMEWEVVNQLMIRTTECIFIDWNPANEFWFDTELAQRPDTKIINSTFYDNVKYENGIAKFNLSPGQLSDLKEARRKAIKEDREGKRGYWFNWWQVYGKGMPGQLEGVVFNNWQEYTELPKSDFYRMFVIDWGGNDPTTLTELNFCSAFSPHRMYVKQHIYQPQILNSKLIEKLREINKGEPIIVDSARKDKKYELLMAGFPAFGSTKGEGSIIDGIDRMQEFDIFVHKDSPDAINEFKNYSWAKDKITGKCLNEPEDKFNHIIDPCRYGVRFYRNNIKPL